MNAFSKMAGFPMTMNHPAHGRTAVSSIVSKWYEAGHWTGYELQFPDEPETRHLNFVQIGELQSSELEAA